MRLLLSFLLSALAFRESVVSEGLVFDMSLFYGVNTVAVERLVWRKSGIFVPVALGVGVVVGTNPCAHASLYFLRSGFNK